jgi:hypothetical protein
MGQRSQYWSCTPFADWIRGIEKGGAKTGRGWREWEAEAKTKYPIRYWIAEEALDAVQNFLWWPIDKIYDVKYYVNNRWVTRTHSLTAHPRDIKPGDWCDVGNRFLPCLFNELVDFVEVEIAWWHLAWSPEERHKYNMPWWAVGWWRIRTWRCPQAGLDNLDWQSKLVWTEDEVGDDKEKIGKPTYQAEKALEILALYKWWKEVYPNRPDVHDASGWTAYCDMRRERGDHMLDLEDRSPEEAEMSRKALDKSHEIEQAYEAEDEAMMIRLIKIRNSLWT